MSNDLPQPTIDSEYQDLQRIYLDWHDGRRPLSGFIKDIKKWAAQEANKARLDELKWAKAAEIGKYKIDMRYNARVKELTALTADKEQA